MRPTAALRHLRFRPVPVLPDASVSTFRNLAFDAERPYLFPRGTFASLPAIHAWFHAPSSAAAGSWQLNLPALLPFGTASVQTELTAVSSSSSASFQRAEAPLSLFLGYISSQQSSLSAASGRSESLVVAQSSLSQLPSGLRDTVPTPPIILQAGKGDVYDASLWLGLAPTVTPLHRDPNPNVLVQIAGRKQVRLLNPQRGTRVRRDLAAGKEGEVSMMAGPERDSLEKAIWEAELVEDELDADGCEAEIGVGDGLFIPKGWWHAVHGLGPGITGSVNWWFR